MTHSFSTECHVGFPLLSVKFRGDEKVHGTQLLTQDRDIYTLKQFCLLYWWCLPLSLSFSCCNTHSSLSFLETSSHTGMSPSDIGLPPVAGQLQFLPLSLLPRNSWEVKQNQQISKVGRCMFKWVDMKVSQAESTCLYIRSFPFREVFCDLSFL